MVGWGVLVLRVAARPVMMRALATFGAIAAPVAIVFGPQGLEAKDLVRAMNGSIGLRLALWIGWLILAAPAAKTVFHAPGTIMLRSLMPRRQLIPQAMLLASIVHLPWAMLFLRGGGVLAMLGATSTAIAVESSWVARRYWLIAISFGALLANDKVMLVGVILAPIAVHAAWMRAPELEDRAWQWIRSSSAGLMNVVIAHVLRLGRFERARLVFATMLMSMGGAGLLTLRSDPTPRPITRALLVMALPIVLTASMFVAPLRESERQMNTLLRSLRVRRGLVLGAFVMALATPTTALAAATTSVSLTFAKVSSLGAIVAAVSASAIGWCLLVSLWSRRKQ